MNLTSFFENKAKLLFKIYGNKFFLKSLFSGGVSALANLFFLYALIEWFGFYYLASAIISFSLSIVVNFLLQKFWTFNYEQVELLHRQLGKFFLTAMLNLIVNTILMFIAVGVFHLWYFGSQVIIAGLLVWFNFFAYKMLIFR